MGTPPSVSLVCSHVDCFHPLTVINNTGPDFNNTNLYVDICFHLSHVDRCQEQNFLSPNWLCYFPQPICGELSFLHIHTATVCLFECCHPGGMKYLTSGFDHLDISLNTNIEHLFLCWLATWMPSLTKCLFKSFAPRDRFGLGALR